MKLLRRDPSEATADDCLAHRCEKHESLEFLIEGAATAEEGAECAICAIDVAMRMLVNDVIAPIGVAFIQAEGQLRLLGVDKNPRTAPLFALLVAMCEKNAEGDFEVLAQKVLDPLTGNVPEPERKM